MANQMEDPFAEMRRMMEDLLGFPAGAFSPASNILRDMERINRALGEGFTMLQEVMTPQDLLDRIEALHPDQAPLPLRKAFEDIMNLPRTMWELRPPPPDGYLRRY